MGRTQKNPSPRHEMSESNSASVSDSESESSLDEEIENQVLNITRKIKSEPKVSSEDSESDSDDDSDEVLTQKNPIINITKPSTSSERVEFEKENIKQTLKKEVIDHKELSSRETTVKTESSEDASSDNDEHIFETNKYVFNKLSDKLPLNINSKVNEPTQSSDDSSSTLSLQDTLSGAFLGKEKANSKKKPLSKQVQSNSTERLSSDESSSDGSEQNSSQGVSTIRSNENVNANEKVMKKSKSPNKRNSNQNTSKDLAIKSTPEVLKQNKRKKNNLTEYAQNLDNTDQVFQQAGVEIKRSNTSEDTSKNKVQVLQHIKFTPVKPQELLHELHPNLKPVNIRDNFKISNNEDVYFLRIPITINPMNLLNKELDLVQGSKLKIERDKYELHSSNKTPAPILLIGNESRVITPINTFFLNKHIKTTKIPDLEFIESCSIPLPENLKPRHPLFGSNYEEKIVLSEDVELRLQKAIKDCLKQEAKIKKKKKKKPEAEDDLQNEVIFSLLGNHTTQRTVENEEQYDSAFGSSESKIYSAKKKKNKRKSMDESSESIKVTKQSPVVEDILDSPKKKKSKTKKNSSVELMDKVIKAEVLNNGEYEELSIIAPTKKTRKKKNKKNESDSISEDYSMIESRMIDIKPEFPTEEDFEHTKTTEVPSPYVIEKTDKVVKKKKKRRSSQREEEEETLNDEVLNNIKQEIMSDFSSVSKKRKRTLALAGENNDSGSSVSKKRKQTVSLSGENNDSGVVHKKSKKSKKNTSLKDFDLENELELLLETVKKDRKING